MIKKNFALQCHIYTKWSFCISIHENFKQKKIKTDTHRRIWILLHLHIIFIQFYQKQCHVYWLFNNSFFASGRICSAFFYFKHVSEWYNATCLMFDSSCITNGATDDRNLSDQAQHSSKVNDELFSAVMLYMDHVHHTYYVLDKSY